MKTKQVTLRRSWSILFFKSRIHVITTPMVSVNMEIKTGFVIKTSPTLSNRTETSFNSHMAHDDMEH